MYGCWDVFDIAKPSETQNKTLQWAYRSTEPINLWLLPCTRRGIYAQDIMDTEGLTLARN